MLSPWERLPSLGVSERVRRTALVRYRAPVWCRYSVLLPLHRHTFTPTVRRPGDGFDIGGAERSALRCDVLEQQRSESLERLPMAARSI